jgi:hypothetical protein
VTDAPQALRLPQLVPLREFIVSPGFGGAAAFAAAVIVFCALAYGYRRAGKRFAQELEQREHHHQQVREDDERAKALQRCWEKLKWLVETTGIEPAASEGATLGLGPELAQELLRGLLRDVQQLGDDTLAKAIAVYHSQLALVLAQQGGPLSALRPNASKSTDGQRRTPTASSTTEKTEPPPTQAANQSRTSTAEVTVGERRHGR